MSNSSETPRDPQPLSGGAGSSLPASQIPRVVGIDVATSQTQRLLICPRTHSWQCKQGTEVRPAYASLPEFMDYLANSVNIMSLMWLPWSPQGQCTGHTSLGSFGFHTHLCLLHPCQGTRKIFMGWGPRASRSIPPPLGPLGEVGAPRAQAAAHHQALSLNSARSPQQAEAGSTETGSATNSCVLIWAPCLLQPQFPHLTKEVKEPEMAGNTR